MFAALDPRSFRPEHLIERAYKCVRPQRPFDRAVDAECDAARAKDHAVHLAQGLWLIRKELESELAKNYVEVTGWKGQIKCAALLPADRLSSI